MEKEEIKEQKGVIKIPEEHIANASGFNEINTTKPIGDKGAVEELDKSLKKEDKV